MAVIRPTILAAVILAYACDDGLGEVPAALRVGRAGHAFDHVSDINEQAAAAAASGASIIYATGMGGFGYTGLPAEPELARHRELTTAYNRKAKSLGIELSLGYLCATSIVGLKTFDDGWSEQFRNSFKTIPAQWRQQDQQGAPLGSWYGGEYHPACMNHPDWRTYEKFMVRQQLETGHDGIFFDNPTVHPQGCYCEHCRANFAEFLRNERLKLPPGNDIASVEALRELAATHPTEFLRFRATIARDFLRDIREYARTINPRALVTCNNSLNSPDRLYAQSRMHGYNIEELSKVQDFVVVEDMATQPRVEGSQTFEYGPTYRQLHAISQGKPIVAVTLVGGDYHTAPNLVRLAMAEAAAHGASYLSWPTWPQAQRERMSRSVREQADFLRTHEELLNDAPARDDVVLFLPFQRWADTDDCAASNLAAALTRANVQYRVVAEVGLTSLHESGHRPVVLLESRSVLTSDAKQSMAEYEQLGGKVVTAERDDWLEHVTQAVQRPSIVVEDPATVRAVVRDQPGRTIIHLYNLHVERRSSFEDHVMPALDIKLKVRVPAAEVREVQLFTADDAGSKGRITFQSIERHGENQSSLHVLVPRLEISAIMVIDH